MCTPDSIFAQVMQTERLRSVSFLPAESRRLLVRRRGEEVAMVWTRRPRLLGLWPARDGTGRVGLENRKLRFFRFQESLFS